MTDWIPRINRTWLNIKKTEDELRRGVITEPPPEPPDWAAPPTRDFPWVSAMTDPKGLQQAGAFFFPTPWQKPEREKELFGATYEEAFKPMPLKMRVPFELAVAVALPPYGIGGVKGAKSLWGVLKIADKLEIVKSLGLADDVAKLRWNKIVPEARGKIEEILLRKIDIAKEAKLLGKIKPPVTPEVTKIPQDVVISLNDESITEGIFNLMGVKLFNNLLKYQTPSKGGYSKLLQIVAEQSDANPKLKEAIINALREKGVPAEFNVYHGGAKPIGKYTNVTLDEMNAQWFAEMRQGGRVYSYTVKLKDIVGMGDISTNELFVKTGSLKIRVTPVPPKVTIPKAPIAPEVTKLFDVPDSKVIEATITRSGWTDRIARQFGRKPVFKQITEASGGKAATVGTTEAVEDVTTRALLIGQRVRETVLNQRGVALARLRLISQNPVELFGADEVTTIASKVTPKVKGASLVLGDIMEHPTSYILNDKQMAYIKEIHRVSDLITGAMEREGIRIGKIPFDEFSHWVHRVVKGRMVEGKLVEIGRGFGRIGAKQSAERIRFYETAFEGVEKGLVYSNNPESILDLYIQGAAKRISDQRIAQQVAKFGKLPTERMPAGVIPTAEEATAIYRITRNMISAINRAGRGEKLPAPTIKSIRNRFPDLAEKISAAGTDKKLLKPLLNEAKLLRENAQDAFWVAKRARVRAGQIARTPRVGEEAVINHPAFQGKIYPRAMADAINDYWADRGVGVLRGIASFSSFLRTTVATADASVYFIQGLPSIARHPKAWGRSVGLGFEALFKPSTINKYFEKEMPSILERIQHGGFSGAFEYMEAMPALRGIGRAITSKIGKPHLGEQVVTQTYGRFEALFTMVGEVIRNESWKGLRGSAKNTDELFQIARHLDRMSGVMSMKALGIGATQQQGETAFMWFAPRYTRAGFALIGDAFKGGLTGKLAREALSSMMVAGAAAYYGVCKALGQEPNFDPSTGKFMTVKITDPITGAERYFGIGGIMTALIRAGADVSYSIASVGENSPLDFKTFDRWDNPLVKFVYGRTSAATSLATQLGMGQNYFGQPFETPEDYGRYMGQRVLPIAFQELLETEQGISPTALGAEFIGMRTFPYKEAKAPPSKFPWPKPTKEGGGFPWPKP